MTAIRLPLLAYKSGIIKKYSGYSEVSNVVRMRRVLLLMVLFDKLLEIIYLLYSYSVHESPSELNTRSFSIFASLEIKQVNSFLYSELSCNEQFNIEELVSLVRNCILIINGFPELLC